MTDAEVIAEYDAYIALVVSKRRRATGNLPLCPFAAAARRTKKISYRIGPITRDGAVETSLAWVATGPGHDETLILLDPDRALPIEQLRALVEPLRQALRPLGWIAFVGHPDDGWTMAGIETRRDPFPSIRVYHRGYLKDGELALEAGGRYYARIGDDELEHWEDPT